MPPRAQPRTAAGPRSVQAPPHRAAAGSRRTAGHLGCTCWWLRSGPVPLAPPDQGAAWRRRGGGRPSWPSVLACGSCSGKQERRPLAWPGLARKWQLVHAGARRAAYSSCGLQSRWAAQRCPWCADLPMPGRRSSACSSWAWRYCARACKRRTSLRRCCSCGWGSHTQGHNKRPWGCVTHAITGYCFQFSPAAQSTCPESVWRQGTLVVVHKGFVNRLRQLVGLASMHTSWLVLLYFCTARNNAQLLISLCGWSLKQPRMHSCSAVNIDHPSSDDSGPAHCSKLALKDAVPGASSHLDRLRLVRILLELFVPCYVRPRRRKHAHGASVCPRHLRRALSLLCPTHYMPPQRCTMVD